jgi:hypothetical protein
MQQIDLDLLYAIIKQLDESCDVELAELRSQNKVTQSRRPHFEEKHFNLIVMKYCSITGANIRM